MKKTLLTILLVFILKLLSAQQTIIIEGTYQGENLIVDNPSASNGLGYCVYEVLVNGKISTDEINSNSFEVDFSAFNLKVGTPVTVTIKHKEGCKPNVVNDKVLQPKSTFDTESITIDLKGNMTWKTTGETGNLDFVVEQFKWNKWVKVGVVRGKGTSGLNTYTAKIDLHSGKNKVRVKQMDYTRHPRYSPDASINNINMPAVEFKRKGSKILFTAPTNYELYDMYGQRKLVGKGIELDISSLSKGTYYLNYDNAMGEFSK